MQRGKTNTILANSYLVIIILGTSYIFSLFYVCSAGVPKPGQLGGTQDLQ